MGFPCGFVSAPREQLIAVGPWAPIFRLRAAAPGETRLIREITL